MSDTLIPTALAFARKGHAVLPLHWPVEERGRPVCSCMGHRRGRPCIRSAAKHPYGKLAPNGLLSASTDSGLIKYWFAVAAPAANLGVCTDKLLVLDIDPRHDGDASLAALEREHGELPQTWRVLTGGGGEHIMFDAPKEVRIASLIAEQMDNPPLGHGIDVRARSGYIVGVGSRHICGRSYHWSVDHHPAETPLAPPPDWLVERLFARTNNNNNHAPVASTEWTKLVTGPVAEYRDAAVARIVGHLLRRWVDTAVVLSLAHAWNASHCTPALTDCEVIAIVNRIAAREARRLDQENRDEGR